MNAVQVSTEASYRVAEHHPFSSGGNRYLYLTPSGSVFRLSGLSECLFDLLSECSLSRFELTHEARSHGFDAGEIEETIDAMEHHDVILSGVTRSTFPKLPTSDFPLQRIVLNVTNQCNLACGYCYEYSDDKIAKTQDKPKYMSDEIVRASIDTLIRESAGRPKLHVTFFGGETLLNFHAMQFGVAYAKEQAASVGKTVDFSLTTNATLLTEEIVDFLAENRVGVTVSIDGDRELHDRMRIFHNGRGSYDIIAPKIRMLLARHRTNSIGARVTLSAGVSEVRRIYDHLTQDLGFKGVGFSPATASPDRLYHIGARKMDGVLDEFTDLAMEYMEHAVNGKPHYFTNVSDTIKELHTGVSKAYTCGAGLGLLGVSTAGDIGACHRFVDAPVAQMGHVQNGGVDQAARRDFLERHHIGARQDCHTCWVRPVCAGGCYHESFINYGETSASSLHQCDRVRGWIELCLKIYVEIGDRNPGFLQHFEDN